MITLEITDQDGNVVQSIEFVPGVSRIVGDGDGPLVIEDARVDGVDGVRVELD